MIRPAPASFARWLSRATVAVLVSVTASTASAAPGTGVPGRAVASGTALSCTARTVAGRPVSFSPPLTMANRQVTVTGSFRLTDCSSPNRTRRGPASGVFTFRGTGHAGCTSASGISGKATVTWYDRAGHRVGTSTVRPAGRRTSSFNPSDALFDGTVTAGVLTGARVSGRAVPTSDVTSCVSSGLRTLHGAGKMAFSF
ncbi:hypothetical protein PV682_31930 [Streptomyces niveiscabiei]|uniref:hypothetical protein n=1 Tax=Streptomyces niveiscabiei TaxID=164115 RepID=UPI0029BD9F0C|nr:hypothetical protein [Streptomyces niveiscabiei]MDX3386033.1 hypothetical protein [Streptomyces niveiscabiei]